MILPTEIQRPIASADDFVHRLFSSHMTSDNSKKPINPQQFDNRSHPKNSASPLQNIQELSPQQKLTIQYFSQQTQQFSSQHQQNLFHQQLLQQQQLIKFVQMYRQQQRQNQKQQVESQQQNEQQAQPQQLHEQHDQQQINQSQQILQQPFLHFQQKHSKQRSPLENLNNNNKKNNMNNNNNNFILQTN